MTRWKKIVLIVASCLLVMIAAVTIVFNSETIQTRLVNSLTVLYTRQCAPSRIEVGSVRYAFPARLTIRDLYLTDQQGDSLLYVKRVYVHLSPLSLLHDRLCLRRVEVEDVRGNVYHVSDSTLNVTFLVEALSSKDTTKTSDSTRLSDVQLPHVSLSAVHVRYDSLEVDIPQLTVSLPHCSMPLIEGSISDGSIRARRIGRGEELCVEKMGLSVEVNDSLIEVSSFRIELPHSVVDLSGRLYGTPDRFQAIEPSLKINTFQLSPRDLSLLVPPLSSVRDYIDMRGRLGGRVDSLSVRDLALLFNGESVFRGELSVVGLPSWRELEVEASCTDFFFPTRSVEHLIAEITREPFVFPDEVHRLGSIHYRGTARGRDGHLDVHGALTTQVGTLTLCGQCTVDSTLTHGEAHGTLSTSRWELGQLLANDEIGDIGLSLTTLVQWDSVRALSGEVSMQMDHLTYKTYPYHDLMLRGTFDGWSGVLRAGIEDPNLSWSLAGLFDLNPLRDEAIQALSSIALEMRLNRFYPDALHLTDKYLDSEFSTVIRIKEEFSDWDHVDGVISIDSTYMRYGSAEAWIRQQQLLSTYTESINHIRLAGDILNGELSGRFMPSRMGIVVAQQIAHYLPSFFSEARYEQLQTSPTDMYWDCKLEAHGLQPLQDVLMLPIRISDDLLVNSHLNEAEDTWILDVSLPGLSIHDKAHLHHIDLHADNADARGNVGLSLELDSLQIGLDVSAWNDSIDLLIDMDALPPYNNHSHLRVLTHLSHYASCPFVETHIFPGYIQFGDSLYHLDESRIVYNAFDTTLMVEDLRLRGHDQYLEVDGVASRYASDSLSIVLHAINMGLIMPYLLPERTLTVSGWASGWANLYSVLNKPIFEAQVQLDSTLFNGAYFGTAKAEVSLNKVTNDIDIRGEVERFGRRAAEVEGLVESKKGRFRIDIRPDSLPLNFIEHWTHAFLQDITGNVSGTVSVRGEGKKTYVLTRALPHHVGLTIPFTGCTYYVEDSIYMDSTSISFPGLTLHDVEGNPFQFDGVLTHNEYFQDFRLDLHVQLRDPALVFDLPYKYGEMMQGKVYATGLVDLTGPDNDIYLNASAVTTGKSSFRLSLGGASSARDNSFITFVHHVADSVLSGEGSLSTRSTRHQQDSTFLPQRKIKNKLFTGNNRFRVGMSLDIDPQTLFQLVLDQRTGDMIEARGDGAIKISVDDATDELTLVGTYELEKGKMGFTIGNLIRRDFTIDPGSEIVWNGKAEKPILNVTARYQVVASLKDLFGSETDKIVSGRTSVPVNTLIHLTGSLEDPIIRFSIELPKSEDNIETQVRAVINTDEMMMRQVVYLLVFGKFFTPEYMKTSTTNNTALNDTYALLSSTITGQINNWLGKLTNVFTLGFNVRQEGTEQNASREYEAVFQLQPIDRLIINGNFGYRYNDVSNRPFFGDIDIECLLTPNGKYRLRGYSHTVDKYSLKQASTIQGIGFIFRHDFNWVNPDKKQQKLTDSTAVPVDSTIFVE